MLHNLDKKVDVYYRFSNHPKLKLAYQAFKLVAESSTYKIFEAEACDSNEKHRIRVLDRSKQFVKKEYDLMATLFVKELLYLQSRYPGSILTNTFEISDDGQQIGCATLPYLPLSCQLDESTEIFNPKDPQLIQQLISDVLNDIKFLWKNMQIRKVMDVLGLESLCFMKEKEAFLLSDWSKLFETGTDNLSLSVAPTTPIQGKRLTSQELAGEIKAIALTVLKLNKIDFSKIEGMSQVPGSNSEEFTFVVESTLSKSFNEEKKGIQQLIGNMLTLEPLNLPNLEELRIKDVRYQAPVNPVAEESKQIAEPETQISSQSKIEQVKQVPDKREDAASLKKSIVITGKLIFKAKQAHLPKLSYLR